MVEASISFDSGDVGVRYHPHGFKTHIFNYWHSHRPRRVREIGFGYEEDGP